MYAWSYYSRWGVLLCSTWVLLSCPTRAQTPSGDASRVKEVQIRLGGSWLHPDRYANDRQEAPPVIADLYDQTFSVHGEVDLFLSPDVSAAAALVFLWERERYDDRICPVVAPCFFAKTSAAFAFLLPEVRIKYHRRRGRSDLYVGAELGYGLTRIALRQTLIPDDEGSVSPRTEEAHHRASGVGALFLTGFSYDVRSNMPLFIEVGYRRLSTGTWEHRAGEPSILGEVTGFHFTGLFSTLGLAFRL